MGFSQAPAKNALAAPRLAALIALHGDEICARWSTLLRGLEGGTYARRSAGEIDLWTRDGVSSILETLENGVPNVLFDYAERLGAMRVEQGFAIEEVIEGLALLRTAIIQVVLPGTAEGGDILPDLSRLDACHLALLKRFAASYAQHSVAELHAEQDRTALMLRTAQLVGTTLDLSRMLPRIATQIASALDALQCSIYLWSGSGRYLEQKASTPDRQVARQRLVQKIDPGQEPFTVLESDVGTLVWRGTRAGALLAAPGEVTAATAAAILLPIFLGRGLVGLAVALHQGDSTGPDERRLSLAEGVAASVAPAIKNAIRYSRVRDEAERTRRLQTSTAKLLEMQSLEDLLEIICCEARDLSGSPGTAVLLDREWNGTSRSHGTGLAAGRAKELWEESLSGGESLLAMPLQVEERRHGTLILIKPQSFGTEQMLLLEPFARQAAAAIAHVLLHEQDERLAALEERQRLARELHDSVSQSLYAATLYSETALRLLGSADAVGASGVVQELRDTTLDALRQMRLLVFELRPPIVAREGLASALEARLAAVEGRAGITTHFVADKVDDLPRATAEGLYGIAREAMNNILKHASASEIHVHLGSDRDTVLLEITDDGAGFDRGTLASAGGLGIAGMHERAAAIGARLDISSAPAEGTRIRVTAPIEPHRHPRPHGAQP